MNEFDEVTPEDKVTILKRLDLRQYKPSCRTMFFPDGPVRLYFPWCSFGSLWWTHDDRNRKPAGLVVVFFHLRAWNSLEDAPEVLGVCNNLELGNLLHLGGPVVCVGEAALHGIFDGSLTPAGAFWLSKNGAGAARSLDRLQRLKAPNFSWVRPIENQDWTILKCYSKFPIWRGSRGGSVAEHAL